MFLPELPFVLCFTKLLVDRFVGKVLACVMDLFINLSEFKRIQDTREEIADELNELEDMIAETREKRWLYSVKVHV